MFISGSKSFTNALTGNDDISVRVARCAYLCTYRADMQRMWTLILPLPWRMTSNEHDGKCKRKQSLQCIQVSKAVADPLPGHR